MQPQTKNEFRDSIYHEIQKHLPQTANFKSGSIFRLFIEIFAEFLSSVQKQFLSIIPQIFTQTASAEWLDKHAEQIGLKRIPARKCQGIINLYRKNTESNITIDSGKLFSTKPNSKGISIRYRSLEKTIMKENEKECQILVEAEEEGSIANVSPHQITKIINPISGIDSVDNQSGWITTPGLDNETDLKLQTRCAAQWKGLNGANRDAYISWAKEIKGIGEVLPISTSRGLGTVDIIITGQGNIQAGKELIQEVQNHIDMHKPIGTDAKVIATIEKFIPISVKITTIKNSTVTKSLVEEVIEEFFQKISIGSDFEPSKLSATIFRLDGIKSIDTLSMQHVSITNKQIARKDNLEITIEVDNES